MKKTTIYCLPFAGGNKYSYRAYEERAGAALQFLPLEYPGRGARMREPLLTDMEAIAEDLYRQLNPSLTGTPYVLYGHSMGGLALLLLLRKISSRGKPLPQQVFITGTTGPSAYFRTKKARHLLSKPAFIQEIKDLDGSPQEILQDKELLDYFEPILRADFKAAETYTYHPQEKLNIPMTVITGDKEQMEEEDIRSWQEETIQPVDFRKMPGKHFFIFANAPQIVQLISEKISQPHKILDHDRR